MIRETYSKRKALFVKFYNITNFHEYADKYQITMDRYCGPDAGMILHPEIGANSGYFNATTAHKCNNKFVGISAKLDAFLDSPRDGILRIFFATEDIQKDEEIFINYGYPLEKAPTWYRMQQEKKEWYMILLKKFFTVKNWGKHHNHPTNNLTHLIFKEYEVNCWLKSW